MTDNEKQTTIKNNVNCTDCKWYQCYIHDGKYGFGLYDSCKLNHVLKGEICDDFQLIQINYEKGY